MKSWIIVRLIILPVFIALIFPLVLKAQSAKSYSLRRYNNGRVALKSGEIFQAKKLVLTQDKVTFRVKDSGEAKSYPVPQVAYVSRIRNQAAKGAFIGGGIMLTAVLAGVAQVEADPTMELKSNAAAIGTGLTAGGIILGAIIGSALKGDKMVFKDGQFVVKLDRPFSSSRPRQAVGFEFFCFTLAF